MSGQQRIHSTDDRFRRDLTHWDARWTGENSVTGVADFPCK